MDQGGLAIGPVPDEEADHRREHHQQREQREEGVVRDERCERRAAVIPELAHDRDREGQPRPAFLHRIDVTGHVPGSAQDRSAPFAHGGQAGGSGTARSLTPPSEMIETASRAIKPDARTTGRPPPRVRRVRSSG